MMKAPKAIFNTLSPLAIILPFLISVVTWPHINQAQSNRSAIGKASAPEASVSTASSQEPSRTSVKPPGQERDGGPDFEGRQAKAIRQSGNSCRSSNLDAVDAPVAGDTLFVSDCPVDGDLDTDCSTGQLVIKLRVPRVITREQQRLLVQNGLLAPTARLTLPAYDVDSSLATACECPSSPEPEFDLVKFNNQEVKNGNGTPYLEGSCNNWRLNSFDVPLDLITFASDPGPGGTAAPGVNTITIDIDVKNQQKCWCTSVDWVSLEIFTPVRPLVMVHGILSSGETWMAKPSSMFPEAINFFEKVRQYGVPVSAITLDPSGGVVKNLNSIEENAVTVGKAVEADRRRWGVNKLNLLCHSKGGLDSREFVEFNDGVDKLVQLGTPNAGSPLADAIQSALISSLPRLTVFTNLFLTPAAYQLTTAYMRYYNWAHGLNADVSYYSIAGDYRHECTFFNCSQNRFTRALLTYITGPGDTIVPIDSALALNQATRSFYVTQADNFQAIHEGMTNSTISFDGAWAYLIGPSSPAAEMGGGGVLAQSALAGEAIASSMSGAAQQATLSRTAGVAGQLSQGGRESHQMPVSEPKTTTFTLLQDGGDLDLVLVSPSGQRFDAQTTISNSQVQRSEGDFFGSRLEAYTLTQPEVGLWRVEISAPLVTSLSGTAAYVVNAWVEGSAFNLNGDLSGLNVRRGNPIRLSASPVQNGQPIRGATVTALVVMPDGSPRNVTLRDDGAVGDSVANDGNYNALFSETQSPGRYRMVYRSSGGSGGATPLFSRETAALATVSQSLSTFSGDYDDYGKDLNGDGFYDNLVVVAGLDITRAGGYRVNGVLVDARGNRVDAAAKATLREGYNEVELKFDGRTILRNGVDGPYKLAEIRLIEDESGEVFPVDVQSNVYQTFAYKVSDFQQSAIRLTGRGTATGIDTNANKRFDILRVEVEANLGKAGDYTWSARLTDRLGKEVGYATQKGALKIGINLIRFDFDGKRIGQIRSDGPYFLRGLIIFSNGSSLTTEDVYTTEVFQASQFEGFKPDNPVPSFIGAVPDGATAGSPQIILTITGSNFVPESQLLWNGGARQTVVDSATQLRATITAADLANASKPTITISSPVPGGGISQPFAFVIHPRPAPSAEQEPNEELSQASPLPFPGKLRGRATVGDAFSLYAIYPNGQTDGFEDFFALNLTQATPIELRLTVDTPSADLDLFLLRENNGQLDYVGISINRAGMNERIVSGVPLSAGRYIVAVSAYRGFSAYTISAGVPDPRLLYLTFDNYLEGVEGEKPLSSPQRPIYAGGLFSPGLAISSGTYLTYRNNNDLNPQEGTLELWIKPKWNGNDSRSHYILRQGDSGGILIGKDSANNLRLILNRKGANGQPEIDVGFSIADWKVNNWHHLAFTWSNSGKVIRIYIDGQLKASRTLTGALPTIADTLLQIGGDGFGSYLDAVVDELCIFGRALTSQEITARISNP